MGIKHFFYWFKQQFNENVYKIKKSEILRDNLDDDVDIDTLLIDMNGIFHNSAQKIYKYGNFKPKPRLLRNKKNIKKIKGLRAQIKVFEDVCNTVETLVKIVAPQKNLVLCIDGPAPISKQNQQRQRRYRSAMSLTEDDNYYSDFNSTCITPGTKFMDYLSKYIDWYIRKRINEDLKWRTLNIIFSSEKVPGEGEHKCVQFIRNHGDKNDTYCITGMDADLIMLTLATHVPNFYILREDMYSNENDFFCIDMKSIRINLVKNLKWKEEKFKYNPKSAIDDFIVLCFILGNDFLPHIPSIEIIESGIELLLKVYKETCTYYGHITTQQNDNIILNINSLKVFLGSVGNFEKENFEKKMNKRKSFFPDPLLEKYSTQENNGNWKFDIKEYKKEYYNKCFPDGINIEKICHDYIEGMQWVLSYYTKGVSNWEWNFKYHYAPPASDLAKYCNTFVFPKYNNSEPYTPFMQLLCVLPTKCAYLLPEPLAKLLTYKNSPLYKYCPTDVEIDLSGKRKEWEGIVLLPNIDFELFKKCYSENIHNVHKNDLKRNILCKSINYKYNEFHSRTFCSYYGNIENSSVETLSIDL